MTNPISAALNYLHRNRGLSAEERARTAEARRVALEQRKMADGLRTTVTDLERRNHFGLKIHAALQERPNV